MDDFTRKHAIDNAVRKLSKSKTEKLNAQRRASLQVQAFIKVQKYLSYVKSGVEPQEAASRAGIHLPVSHDTNPQELLYQLQKDL